MSEAPITDWLAHLRRVVACAEAIAATATISTAEVRSPKLLSICLLARSTLNAQAAAILLQDGFVVEARTLARSILENKFYLYALATDGERFIQKMVDDEIRSQTARGQTLLSQAREGMPDDIRERLHGYLRALRDERPNGTTSLNPKAIVESTDISAAYVFYQHLSADAAHPSLKALNRHVVTTQQEEIRAISLKPPMRIGEVRETALIATMALLGVCVAANQILGATTGGESLPALVKEYQGLTENSGLTSG
jgi:hypothetical protein